VSTVQAFLEKTRQAPIVRSDVLGRLDRIRAAVIEECAQQSFRLVSMASIAKRAKVSTASLYREFGNREALLEHVATFTAPLIAADLVLDMGESEPRKRIVGLLNAQASIFKNPHANWLYRAHVSGEVSDGRGLIPVGAQSRSQIEAFWTKEMEQLQLAGLLSDVEVPDVVNFLLGASQRRSLLALLLFGPRDVSEPSVEAAIESAVDWLLALKDKPLRSANLKIGQRRAPFPSAIQTEVEADLARHHERTDSVSRQKKILAAVVHECSEVGFSQASMASVATRANVSTATLYELFRDKDDMFVKAVAYVAPILTANVTKATDLDNPAERIADMLIQHGSAYLDPFMEWLYRLYVSFEGQGESLAGHLGRASRAMTEQFWRDHLVALEAQGYLAPSDLNVTVNLLLGGVERRTLISVLLLGHSYAPFHGLVEAATFGAQMLFHMLGTPKFFAEFGYAEPDRDVAQSIESARLQYSLSR
jgi:AcrR family transcriptional regulator